MYGLLLYGIQANLIKVSQSKYLKSRTVWRGYYHLTKAMVLENSDGRAREVDTLTGK